MNPLLDQAQEEIREGSRIRELICNLLVENGNNASASFGLHKNSRLSWRGLIMDGLSMEKDF